MRLFEQNKYLTSTNNEGLKYIRSVNVDSQFCFEFEWGILSQMRSCLNVSLYVRDFLRDELEFEPVGEYSFFKRISVIPFRLKQ